MIIDPSIIINGTVYTDMVCECMYMKREIFFSAPQCLLCEQCSLLLLAFQSLFEFICRINTLPAMLPFLTSWPCTPLGSVGQSSREPATGSMREREKNSGRKKMHRFRYKNTNLAGFIELNDDTMTAEMLREQLNLVPRICSVYLHKKGSKTDQNNAGNHAQEHNLMVDVIIKNRVKTLEFEVTKHQNIKEKNAPKTITVCFKTTSADRVCEGWRILRYVCNGRELFPEKVKNWHAEIVAKYGSNVGEEEDCRTQTVPAPCSAEQLIKVRAETAVLPPQVENNVLHGERNTTQPAPATGSAETSLASDTKDAVLEYEAGSKSTAWLPAYLQEALYIDNLKRIDTATSDIQMMKMRDNTHVRWRCPVDPNRDVDMYEKMLHLDRRATGQKYEEITSAAPWVDIKAWYSQKWKESLQQMQNLRDTGEARGCLLNHLPDKCIEKRTITVYDSPRASYIALIGLMTKHKGEMVEVGKSTWMLEKGPCPQAEAQLECYSKWNTGKADPNEFGKEENVQACNYDTQPDWEKQEHRLFVPCRGSRDVHWARVVHCTTLGQLFVSFAEEYSAYEIYNYYLSLRIVVVKAPKERPAMSTTVRQERYEDKQEPVHCLISFIRLIV